MLKREMPPVHPGEILGTLFMDELGIGVKQMAEDLDVTPLANIGEYFQKAISIFNTYRQDVIDKWTSYIRSGSKAFLGEQSAEKLRALVNKSLKIGKDVGFIAELVSSKEIYFNEIFGGGGASEFDMVGALNSNFSASQFKNIFGWGHTHVAGFKQFGYLYKTQKDILEYWGTPTDRTGWERALGETNKPDLPRIIGHDYQEFLGRVSPLFIGSPAGITIYNNDAVERSLQFRLFYDWFKK